MTAWASMLIPAGSVVVGAVIAGGAAFGGQVLTHRGSFQREREARRDAFKVARFETERETLLSLQDALLDHVKLMAEVFHADSQQERDEANAALLNNDFKVITLTNRCLAREAADAVVAYTGKVHQAVINGAVSDELGPAFRLAQQLLGVALRQDPFEDDR